MSTRCNILVKDEHSQQWFYRHSDGYPSETAESLKRFVRWMVEGKARRNVVQGSPWLIVLGNTETNEMLAKIREDNKKRKGTMKFSDTHEAYGGGTEPCGGSGGWKVGSYEITDGEHGDIEYLYTIDLHKGTVKIDGRGKSKTYGFEDFLSHDFSNNEP